MKTIELWEDFPEFEAGHHHPTLEYYKADVKRGKGTVVILPDGVYSLRSPHE